MTNKQFDILTLRLGQSLFPGFISSTISKEIGMVSILKKMLKEMALHIFTAM